MAICDGAGEDDVWAPVRATATDPHTATAKRAARVWRERVAMWSGEGKYTPLGGLTSRLNRVINYN